MIDREVIGPTDFFITSDTWFGRSQILEIGKRNVFSSIDKMNEVIISNWNKQIKRNDIVFHLGNFAWDPHTARSVLNRLHGNITFIIGNADDALLEISHEFENVTVSDSQILELPQFDSVICHYPLDVWNGKSTGTIHFHGHTIFSHKTDLRISNRINTCIDFWNYTPLKFSTIKHFINDKK